MPPQGSLQRRFMTLGNTANTDTFVRQYQKLTLETNKQTNEHEFYSFCQKFPKDTEARNSFMVATFSDSLIVVIVYFGAFLRQEFSVKSQKS